MSGGFAFGAELCNGADIGTDTANSRGTGLPTFNTWVQLTASTPIDTAAIAIDLSYNASANWIAICDIGIGGAGSEQPIIPSLCTYAFDSFLFPVAILAGTRISARGTYDQSATFTVNARLFDGGYSPAPCSGVDAVGFDSVNHGGTSVPPSASANTKGGFTQLIASTSVDYLGFYVEVNLGDTNTSASVGAFSLIDIAIGGAGSEIIIVPNIQWYHGASRPRQFYPIPIPAGTRISARCQADAASSAARRVMLYGVYQ